MRATTIWVLDLVGYEARGGNAEVFRTLEAAKAQFPDIEWEQDGVEWCEPDHGSDWDRRVIYPCELGP